MHTEFEWSGALVFGSAAVTLVAAATGLVSRSYHETLLENLALCAVVMASAVVMLQIGAFGTPQGTGVAFYCAAMAGYAVARLAKARTHGTVADAARLATDHARSP